MVGVISYIPAKLAEGRETLFLFRASERAGARRALTQVETSLDRMTRITSIEINCHQLIIVPH